MAAVAAYPDGSMPRGEPEAWDYAVLSGQEVCIEERRPYHP